MKLNQTQGCLTVVIGMVLLSAACAEPTTQRQALPRNFGPVHLGMSEEQFTQITGVTKEDFCAHCADFESKKSVEIENSPGVYPAYLYALPKSARGFTASFYHGKLYSIEASPELAGIQAAKKKYGAIFGQPRTTNWKNGLSFATWEDGVTAVVITYVRQQDRNQGYPLTMPAGTVSSIEYIDKSVRDDIQAHEKVKPSSGAPN